MVTTAARSTITVLNAVQAALRDATVITSTVRLSRELTWQVNQVHRQRGEASWSAPNILPYDAFLHKLWRDWLLRADSAIPLLLNPHQERSLFEQSIAQDSPDGPLQIAATAHAARHAWRLAHAWFLPLSHPQFAATDDCEAFSRWWRTYNSRCHAENWLDSARLPDFLSARLRDGSLTDTAASIVFVGFDELTPQQRSLFDALPRVEQSSPPASFHTTPATLQLQDSREELEQAAHWSRGLLSQDPQTRIAVVIPDLAERRALADRVFREVLHPAPFSSGPRAWHLAPGLPLRQYPLVAAALVGLEAGLPRIGANRAGLLLRSPFFKGSLAERALADARLRRDRCFELTPGQFRALHPSLRDFSPPPAGLLRPSQWAGVFSGMLSGLGWPGDRTLSSDEYQTASKWREALSGFSTLDLTRPSLDYEDALRELRHFTEVLFQPEDQRAPVQILDMDEAAGLTFDHLWIAGLHDEQLPPESRPNPFLPLSLQRELGMPLATAQLAAAEASRKLRRLIACAPDVRLSWPAADGEKVMKPSPLLTQIGGERTAPVLPDRAVHNWQPPAKLEELHDETAPPLAGSAIQSGGVKLLRTIAECPFQAFALYRLNLRPLEDADFGLPPAEKGTTVHTALESLWAELRSHDSLIALSDDQARSLVRRHVEAALANADSTAFRELEQERLEGLLFDFLQYERERQPFTVAWREEKRKVEIGGLTLDVRIDRLDRLADGRRVLIDYKTGQTKPEGWQGPRPREPQIPLYAITSEGPFAAFALARIRTGGLGFTGIQSGQVVSAARTMKNSDSIADEVARWRTVLESLVHEFQSGDARVDPLRGACRFCGIKALCRIGDAAGTESDDAAE